MKILLLDDQRDLMRIYKERLAETKNEIVMVSDMGTALLVMEKARSTSPFDLLVIDLLLKRFEPSFRKEHEQVSEAMSRERFGNIPSGQALGLRLWQSSSRMPYCYLSAHTPYWMKNLGGQTPEFDQVTTAELAQLLLEKGSVKLADLDTTFNMVLALWKAKGW